MQKKVFIITGDYSGDIHAAHVVKELQKNNPDTIIEGIGGENLKNTGIKIFSSQDKMGAFGLSLKIITDHITLGKKVLDYLTNDYKPDLVLLIDYGAFNLKMAKFIKKKTPETKIFYYIPPQIWASRKWRIRTVKKYIDKVLCIFPFEIELYKSYGIDVAYCGHPLVKQLPPPANREEFFKKHNLDLTKKLVSVFPGSRTIELKMLMDTFMKSARLLQKRHPDLQIVVSQAPSIKDNVFDKYKSKCNFKVIKGENHAMLSCSDALMLASGTVALEASLYKTPMIISYKGPWLFYLIYLLVRCINRVSLPNIITNQDIVPELIQWKSNPDTIAYNLEKLLYNKVYRDDNISKLGDVQNKLSEKYSAVEVAKQICEELK
ncbi:lipid-A-disaccharide synthase [bacterium]|nr:lipid-A-disaccharide synthase [bacterium]